MASSCSFTQDSGKGWVQFKVLGSTLYFHFEKLGAYLMYAVNKDLALLRKVCMLSVASQLFDLMQSI